MTHNYITNTDLTSRYDGLYVEIGTDRGGSALHILTHTPCKKLYCVDPYIQYDDYRDAINNVTGDSLFNATRTLLAPFGDRVEMVRDFSDNAVTQIPDNLDLVYIDGNHASKFVYNDLKLWYPKVRPGGVIIGDDLVDLSDDTRDENGDVRIVWAPYCFGFYGVFHALKKFTSEMGITYELSGKQFLIRK